MSNKLSFKKEKTDAWSLLHTKVKAGKKEIGYITGNLSTWKIHLAVKNPEYQDKSKPNCNCPFKWIVLKVSHTTEQEARDFLKANWEKIQEKFQIHYFEE